MNNDGTAENFQIPYASFLNIILHYRNANMVEEIIVPTCSYRMGFKEMALGFVRIRPKTGDLIYYNLWLPSRFANLYLYAVTMPVVFILFLIGQRNAKNKPRSRKSSFSADYSKLV